MGCSLTGSVYLLRPDRRDAAFRPFPTLFQYSPAGNNNPAAQPPCVFSSGRKSGTFPQIERHSRESDWGGGRGWRRCEKFSLKRIVLILPFVFNFFLDLLQAFQIRFLYLTQGLCFVFVIFNFCLLLCLLTAYLAGIIK